MRFAPCAWSGGVSKLRRKSPALPAGNLFWRRVSRTCALAHDCSARIPASLADSATALSPCQTAREGRHIQSEVWFDKLAAYEEKTFNFSVSARPVRRSTCLAVRENASERKSSRSEYLMVALDPKLQ